MTVTRLSQRAARRRGELHRDGGDRRVGQATKAHRGLNLGRLGRVWRNGRERGEKGAR
jgi:hypothetical protein